MVLQRGSANEASASTNITLFDKINHRIEFIVLKDEMNDASTACL